MINNSALVIRLMVFLNVPLLIAVILAIVAGTKEDSSSDSEISTGQNYMDGAVILLLLCFLAFATILGIATTRLRDVLHSERRLLFALLLATPFLFVRLLYSLVSAFSSSQYFDLLKPNVWVEAFMSILMEFIVVTILLIAGIITPVTPRSLVNGEGVLKGRRSQGRWPSINLQNDYVVEPKLSSDSRYNPSVFDANHR